MRIIIASDLYWPNINGIATFGRNLARGLADAGHTVLVIAPSQTGKKYQEAKARGNYEIVRTASMIFPFYQNLRVSLSPTREIKQIVERFEPDVIHLQTPLGIGVGAIAAAKKYHVPLVATNHAMSENLIDNLKLLAPFARQVDYILREYGTRFYSNADYLTLPTMAAIKMLKSDSFSKPYSAISNGIDLGRFQPGPAPADFRARFDIPPDVPLVLYVGRLDAEKHVSVLLNAAQKLLHDHSFHVVVVGFGNDLHRLRDLARHLHITHHVTFTGRVAEEDKPQFFRAASLFVMPSPAELQSIATLEAMASGLPVVAVNAGALYELCQDHRNGYLYDLDNVEQLAAGMAQILDDPDRAAAFGKASLAIAKTHDLKEVIGQFEALYTRLIAERQELAALAGKATG